MQAVPVGVDIAKNVFQIHYVDSDTGEIVNKPLKRAKFLEYFSNRAPCMIGMEACGGAQHWARALTRMGHLVKVMPARFVKAFNIGNKNDAADARAIWFAVQQPCKAIAVKTEAQQAVLALHRMRQQLVKFRTMQMNNLRELLTEYGEVMGKGRASLNEAMPLVLARLVDRVPAVLIDTLREQWNGLTDLDKRIAEIERRLRQWLQEDRAVKSIAAIPGVGVLTATAAVANRDGIFAVACGIEQFKAVRSLTKETGRTMPSQTSPAMPTGTHTEHCRSSRSPPCRWRATAPAQSAQLARRRTDPAATGWQPPASHAWLACWWSS